MKQEDKELLLKDLCARLPYGVRCKDWTYDENDRKIDTIQELEVILPKSMQYRYSGINAEHSIKRIKPYLRPMSSMTKEEESKLHEIATRIVVGEDYYEQHLLNHSKQIDYLNSIHIDYRGLIEKGLALEAPEGMYKTE